jgi:hypothetical protein
MTSPVVVIDPSTTAPAAARVAAENVPGVTEVVDQMCWIEPFSEMCLLPPGPMCP